MMEKVCESKEDYINWDGHDLQLHIPSGALPKGSTTRIIFGASISGKFHLPPSMKLVSAVFLIDVISSACFLEDVELKIPHCLDLSVELCDLVWFIHAPFNKQCQTEVLFEKLNGGIFKPGWEYGLICTRKFCLIAIAIDMSQRNNQSTTMTSLHTLSASDLPETSVQLLPQPIHPKVTAHFCIPGNRTELVWDIYFMVSLKLPSMVKVLINIALMLSYDFITGSYCDLNV